MKRVLSVVAASLIAASLSLVAGPAQGTAAPSSSTPGNTVVAPDGKVYRTLPSPKGVVAGKNHVFKGMPAHPGAVSTLASCDGVGTKACYLYNVGRQFGIAGKIGAAANVKIGGHAGSLNSSTDYHVLSEIAVQSADGKQIVEVGATVDPSVNGGTMEIRPFVYHWINGVGQCYNGCGFVPLAGASVTPGVTALTPGSVHQMGIYHDDATGRWYIGFGGSYIGYYPDSRWTSPPANSGSSVTFNRMQVVQFFGEIASSESKPCSDMGLGIDASQTATAARFSSVTYYNPDYTTDSAAVNLSVSAQPAATAGSPYSTFAAPTLRTFYYGGPMWNAAGTAVGAVGAC